MLNSISSAVQRMTDAVVSRIEPTYGDFLILGVDDRRSKLENVVNQQGVTSPLVVGLLQSACRTDPNPGIREWAQGQLQAHNNPVPDCEWKAVGSDGKVYTRQEMLTVPSLFVVDPVDRLGFLSKPDGHIKVALGNALVCLAIGVIFIVASALFIQSLLSTRTPSPSGSTTTLLFFAAFFIFGIGLAIYGAYQMRQRYQEARNLEQNGALYLGQMKVMRQGWETRQSYNSNTHSTQTRRVHYYLIGFLFKTTADRMIESTRKIYGQRGDLNAALEFAPGTPVAVLYSDAYGFRLL